MTKASGGLSSLLYPRAVAVVGASDNPDKVGGRPLRHLVSHGFGGKLYPVTQRGTPVQGLSSYTSLDALPEVPDVAILSVPAERAYSETGDQPAMSAMFDMALAHRRNRSFRKLVKAYAGLTTQQVNQLLRNRNWMEICNDGQT